MLFNPMITMVFYIFGIGLYNFSVRFRAIKNKEIKPAHFKTFDPSFQVPERVTIVGRHYNNQLELPVLFLITCVAAQTMPLYSSYWLVPLAWGFILSRVVHSYIHLGSNNVRLRALAFAAGWLIILAMWIVMMLQAYV